MMQKTQSFQKHPSTPFFAVTANKKKQWQTNLNKVNI